MVYSAVFRIWFDKVFMFFFDIIGLIFYVLWRGVMESVSGLV